MSSVFIDLLLMLAMHSGKMYMPPSFLLWSIRSHANTFTNFDSVFWSKFCFHSYLKLFLYLRSVLFDFE